MIKFLDLGSQYSNIKLEIDQAIQGVIEDSAFIGGKYTKEFERSFASYLGAKHCIGVGNGTDALEIAIESLELPEDGEIIVPANSFAASAEAVVRNGLKVVFADCYFDSMVLDIDDVERKINGNTVAIIAVHLYGHPCNMDGLLELSNKYNLKIIEDCAQAHGSKYKGRFVGTIGDVAAFSFYPGKNLGAYGDGGAIVCDSDTLADKCRMISNHGRLDKYNHQIIGRNSRLDGIQSAVLQVKLKYLDGWMLKRQKQVGLYKEKLSDIQGVDLPIQKDWAHQCYHLFVIKCLNRDKLKEHLESHGVACGIHYPIALPKLEAFGNFSDFSDCLVACSIDSKLLSLPIGEHLDSKDIDAVVELITSFYSYQK